MEKHEKDKIVRFMADTAMSGVVKKVLLDVFMKRQKERDIYSLAAQKMAIDLLDDAWKQLERYENQKEGVEKVKKQVGM